MNEYRVVPCQVAFNMSGFVPMTAQAIDEHAETVELVRLIAPLDGCPQPVGFPRIAVPDFLQGEIRSDASPFRVLSNLVGDRHDQPAASTQPHSPEAVLTSASRPAEQVSVPRLARRGFGVISRSNHLEALAPPAWRGGVSLLASLWGPALVALLRAVLWEAPEGSGVVEGPRVE